MIILLLYIFSNFRGPKIGQGVAFWGLVVGTFSIFQTNARQQAQRRVNEQQNRETREEIDSLHKKVDKFSNQVEESSKKVMNAIDKSKKFLENFNSFSITDIIKNTYDFWNGFDLLTQVLLFNALSSLLLSSLLGSYIFSIYGNYLINRYFNYRI